ncbi:hypothetical protein GUJ93_ZPchr0001g31055 [Zizania palustris]|uniref:non-specific serine/threonine protein kinase n=1 Tax=Zizania palustris TaxID=103762 RepID=A0A8J5S4P5_ZIZPA|nr:hypothetical protein GUJ93_ZPchr0001g31055 [Zizania palustris]
MVISYRYSAGTKLTWILSLQLILVATIQAQSASPTSGFLSIDCGLTNSSSYNDSATNLTYVSDRGYVEGGKAYNIMGQYMEGATSDQEKTLRSFPDGKRNCYTLPSISGSKYLIRTTFTYGNYDKLNSSENGSRFLFGLYIGVNFWTAVNLTNWIPSDTVWKEVITVAPDKFISVCLINIGHGTPFVSALVLRPFDNLMYPFVNTSVSINYFSRLRFGSVDDFITRYPVDNYDRFWESWSFFNSSYPWLNMSTTREVSTVPGDQSFQVPSEILQKASTINSNFSWLNVTVRDDDHLRGFGTPELLPIFHFAEFDSNDSTNRVFDIYSENELLFPNFTASPFRVTSMHQNGRFLRNVNTTFTLRKLPTSPLPPLINAFEVYSLVRMDNRTTASNDVDYMTEVKKYYGLVRNWNGDPCSPIEYSWEGLTCDYAATNPNPKITKVNLSFSGLRGVLDISFMKMASLENLDLSHNNLTGAIPDYQSKSLTVLLEGNPICSTVKDRKSEEQEDYAMYEEETPLHIDIRRFTYAELKLITNNFQTIIGKGGFGTVYHGILENNDEVAIKVLMETSIDESKDFLPEVQTLSKVHHKNLVALIGYCQNKKCLALVYDFMPRGNLQQILREGYDYSLNWEERIHIALDAAQGLEYLHESCNPTIVHRDVKTPNILLDKNLVAKISDFGLSRAFNATDTHISTVAAGTLGYLDPEYHATFQLTIKTDVYSFGIVLLEIVTGQPPVFMDTQTVHLPNWVRQKIAKGSIHDVVDKKLLDQYDATNLQTVIDLAMNCVENASIDRPSMTEVVSVLKVCLPALSSEKQSAASTPRWKNVMDADIPKQSQLMISESSTTSYEGSSFQSGYTSAVPETSGAAIPVPASLSAPASAARCGLSAPSPAKLPARLQCYSCVDAVLKLESKIMAIVYDCLMSAEVRWLLAFQLVLAVCVIQVHADSADAPNDFLSIDCGMTNSGSYNDIVTNLTYVSDKGYVEGGENYNIMAQYMKDATNEQEKTLRSFPYGQQNCYTLPSTSGKKYLIRTTFTYGNYDGLNSSENGSWFLFRLHIGVNFWTTVNLTNWPSDNTIWKEVITVAPDKSIFICLINFGYGTPFVSSLDMKPLQDSMYPFVNTSVSVNCFSRLRFGSVDKIITRYPVDKYDRFWESWYNRSYPWVSLNTTREVRRLPGDDKFQVPSEILQKASTILSNFGLLYITVKAGNILIDSRDLKLLPIFHFAELNDTGINMSRLFNIWSDGEQLFANFSPSLLQVDSMYQNGRFLQNIKTTFTLRKQPTSQLPPLINAFEVYSLVQMDNFTTDSNDVNCTEEIKKYYNVRRNWNGDPCSPIEYCWEGLACDYGNGRQNPRVIRLLNYCLSYVFTSD